MNKLYNYKIYRWLAGGIWFNLKGIGWTTDSTKVNANNFISVEDYATLPQLPRANTRLASKKIGSLIKERNSRIYFWNTPDFYHIGGGTILNAHFFVLNVLAHQKHGEDKFTISELMMVNRLDNIFYNSVDL